MPVFRNPFSGETRGGAWRNDPTCRFNERYFSAKGLTPYVRTGGKVCWDLSYAGCIPGKDNYNPDIDMILADSYAWIRFAPRHISVCLVGEPVLVKAVVIEHRSLSRFELRSPGRSENPEYVVLEIAGGRWPDSPYDSTDHRQFGLISMSMMFGRQHESLLRELRDWLRQVSALEPEGRTEEPGGGRLASGTDEWEHPAGSVENSAEPQTVHTDEPTLTEDPALGRRPGARRRADARRGIPGARRGRGADRGSGTGRESSADARGDRPGRAREDRPGGRSGPAPVSRENQRRQPGEPSPGQTRRPALRTLVVLAETAPDNDEWLSFAATSVGVLTYADQSGRADGAGQHARPAGPPPGPDRGDLGHGHG